MSDYFLLVGHFPDLALAEITTVLKRLGQSPPKLTVYPALIQITVNKLKPFDLQRLLGSVIKIYSVIPSQASLANSLSQDIIQSGHKRCAFSTLDPALDLKRVAVQTKRQVQQTQPSFGYRLLSNPTESAGIDLNHPEYLIASQSKRPHLFKSETVQDLSFWTSKDYGRPRVDPKSGMLPPKIARQLVNLAFPTPISPKSILLDPFCGVGTILTEALELGLQVIGSDIDKTMLEYSATNLNWFTDHFKLPKNFTLHQADAQKPLVFIPPASLDAVVFEGYLGPPDISPSEIPNYVKGLVKMYLGVLKHIQPLLRDHGRLVAALPAYTDLDHVKTLKSLIDRCENLGYTPVADDLWYYRSQARIRRHIVIWQKT